MRIGHGYDVHRLVDGRKLILGGVEVPHSLGLLGHSDADVLLHAIMDALLGAAALGDIGHLFPDTDPAYEGISSVLLLKTVGERISGAGYAISNIDATVIAQKPKLAPYIPAMRKVVAETLGIQEGQVNLKATTEEHLGFSGREEGIAAHAVCLIDALCSEDLEAFAGGLDEIRGSLIIGNRLPNWREVKPCREPCPLG